MLVLRAAIQNPHVHAPLETEATHSTSTQSLKTLSIRSNERYNPVFENYVAAPQAPRASPSRSSFRPISLASFKTQNSFVRYESSTTSNSNQHHQQGDTDSEWQVLVSGSESNDSEADYDDDSGDDASHVETGTVTTVTTVSEHDLVPHALESIVDDASTAASMMNNVSSSVVPEVDATEDGEDDASISTSTSTQREIRHMFTLSHLAGGSSIHLKGGVLRFSFEPDHTDGAAMSNVVCVMHSSNLLVAGNEDGQIAAPESGEVLHQHDDTASIPGSFPSNLSQLDMRDVESIGSEPSLPFGGGHAASVDGSAIARQLKEELTNFAYSLHSTVSSAVEEVGLVFMKVCIET